MITLTFLGLDSLTTVDWALIVALLALSLLALTVYTLVLYRRIPKDDTPLIGQDAVVVAWHGRDQRVEVFGAIWRATRADGDDPSAIKVGDIVRVRAINNLVLIVTRI